MLLRTSTWKREGSPAWSAGGSSTRVTAASRGRAESGTASIVDPAAARLGGDGFGVAAWSRSRRRGGRGDRRAGSGRGRARGRRGDRFRRRASGAPPLGRKRRAPGRGERGGAAELDRRAAPAAGRRRRPSQGISSALPAAAPTEFERSTTTVAGWVSSPRQGEDEGERREEQAEAREHGRERAAPGAAPRQAGARFARKERRRPRRGGRGARRRAATATSGRRGRPGRRRAARGRPGPSAGGQRFGAGADGERPRPVRASAGARAVSV